MDLLEKTSKYIIDPFETHLNAHKEKKQFINKWEKLTTREERIKFCIKYLEENNSGSTKKENKTRFFIYENKTYEIETCTLRYSCDLLDVAKDYKKEEVIEDVIMNTVRDRIYSAIDKNVTLKISNDLRTGQKIYDFSFPHIKQIDN